MSSKKDRIMALHKQGKTTRQIAAKIYLLQTDAPSDEWDRKMAYVRVVIRQRKGTGRSPTDRRYMAAGGQEAWNARRRLRWQTDSAYRERELLRCAAWAAINRRRNQRNRLDESRALWTRNEKTPGGPPPEVSS